MRYIDKLHETVVKFPMTDIWNDSCSLEDLKYAIERGAVGATTNPTIVTAALESELPIWEDTIKRIITDSPSCNEDDAAWQIIEEIGTERAKLLLPAFEASSRAKGRLSMQTNIKNFRNAEKMVAQAIHFNTLGENIQVKIPVTSAGVKAIEEATFAGVNINATVSFTLAQLIQVAEAVERGLDRRTAAGLSNKDMHPVCTIMLGRLDDYIAACASKNNSDVSAEALKWASIAVTKKAYKLYKERGYRTRLLTAAYRRLEHWSEFIGGDIIMTIPHKWQTAIGAAKVEVISRIDDTVDEEVLQELEKLPEFKEAYNEDAQTPEDFDSYKLLHSVVIDFLAGYDKFVKIIRGYFFS